MTTARRVYRSGATTARRPNLHIGRNFSVVGDRVAERARMGHTRRGSYLVPILMPIPADHETSFGSDETLLKAPPESPERRVSRTVAQSLAAIASNIIQPARDPRPDVLPALHLAGASREAVMALQRTLSEPGVQNLRATFRWSAGTTAPSGLPETVTFPSEAAELLERAADLMRRSKVEPGERFTGRIIEVRHPHGQSTGEVTLDTFRRGRACEIRVPVGPDDLQLAYGRVERNETVLVDGRVDPVTTQGLRISNPQAIVPLAETVLFPHGAVTRA